MHAHEMSQATPLAREGAKAGNATSQSLSPRTSVDRFHRGLDLITRRTRCLSLVQAGICPDTSGHVVYYAVATLGVDVLRARQVGNGGNGRNGRNGGNAVRSALWDGRLRDGSLRDGIMPCRCCLRLGLVMRIAACV